MNNAPRKVKVYIGRFQPPHNGHIEVLKNAIATSDHTIVVIGTHQTHRSTKNPWTAYERKDMLRLALSPSERKHTSFVFQEDWINNNIGWSIEVKENTNKAAQASIGDTNYNITLVGCNKDSSTFYFDLFPEWKLELAPHHWGINATDIRASYFNGESDWEKHVPVSTAGYLAAFKAHANCDFLSKSNV